MSTDLSNGLLDCLSLIAEHSILLVARGLKRVSFIFWIVNFCSCPCEAQSFRFTNSSQRSNAHLQWFRVILVLLTRNANVDYQGPWALVVVIFTFDSLIMPAERTISTAGAMLAAFQGKSSTEN